MNQLQILTDLAKAGTTFGKNDQVGTYLNHNGIYEAIEQFTVVPWGQELPYLFVQPDMFVFDLGDSSYSVTLEDDGHDVDRILQAIFHVYTWL